MISSRKAKYQLMIVGLLSQICILCFFLLFSSFSEADECHQKFYTTPPDYSGGRPYIALYTDTGITADNCPYELVLSPYEYSELKIKSDAFDNLENEFMSAEHFDYLTQFLFAAFAFFAYVKGFSNGNTRD